MPEIRITLLADNSVFAPKPAVLGEHGLSVYVEFDSKRILFDTGSGATILHNASQLGIDLTALDMIVISHGHGDHTGGLTSLLPSIRQTDLYIHPDAFIEKAIKTDDGFTCKQPLLRDKLISTGLNVIDRTQNQQFEKGMWLIGPIPRIFNCDDIKMPRRYRKIGQEYRKDTFSDEQILAFDTPEGLVLILGCTHNGLENTVNEAMHVTGAKKVHTIVGGLHLAGVNAARLADIAAHLKQLGIQQLVSCHCTGAKENAILYQHLGDVCRFGRVGQTFMVNW